MSKQYKLEDLVGKFLFHAQSRKVYKCVSIERNEDNPLASNVNLERLGDKKAFAFPVPVVIRGYVELSEEHLEKIEQLKARIERTTTSITLDWLENPPKEDEEGGLGFIVAPTDRDDFKNLVLAQDIKDSIQIGLKKVELKDFLNETWDLKSIEPMDGRCAMNFWGAPGTGKTASVKAIARQLDKKIYQVNYSQIISKWVGDTGKHLAEVFANAKKNRCILFFDEADSMLSRRVSMDSGDPSGTSINQNRNILMQEIDKFNDMIIFATNHFGNYDEALLRRIAQHVEFKLPDESMRKQIFEGHIPKAVTISGDVSYKECAKLTEGFSGGDIKNVCINSMVAAAMLEPRILGQTELVAEITKIKSSKNKHGNGKFKKPIGIEVNLKD